MLNHTALPDSSHGHCQQGAIGGQHEEEGLNFVDHTNFAFPQHTVNRCLGFSSRIAQ